jgi:hypothetical protein
MTRTANTIRRAALRFSALGAAVLMAGAPAYAADKEQATPCFFITQWHGWKAPSPDVLYLGVNANDVYKVDLSAGSSMLQSPGVHLVSHVRGSDSICSAIDLQLAVSDDVGSPGGLGRGLRDGFSGGGGITEPLIASKLTKLTPAEVAAIPKQFRPN